MKAVKEPAFYEHGNIPCEEHWCELLNDENHLHSPFTKDLEIPSDLRKSTIEWIFHLANELKQSSLTLQLAIVYLDKLFLLGKSKEIAKDKYLWGLTVLHLASKYDEID